MRTNQIFSPVYQEISVFCVVELEKEFGVHLIDWEEVGSMTPSQGDKDPTVKALKYSAHLSWVPKLMNCSKIGTIGTNPPFLLSWPLLLPSL